MHTDPLVSMDELGSLPPLLPKKGATLHWDGQGDVHHAESPPALWAPALPSAFQAPGQAAAAFRDRPYLTGVELGLVSPAALPPSGWEQAARLLTVALDPVLLADLVPTETPKVTGELVWGPCEDQPTSFTVSVHAVLLVHAAYEVCPVHRLEIVLDLPAQDPLLHHMALALQTAIAGEGLPGRLYAESVVDALAVHFLRRFGAAGHARQEGQGGLSPYKLRRTLAYIKAHMAQELSLTTLAALAETSPAHFARMFKQVTGLTPHQYVIAYRIEEAKRLLAETEMALLEIGTQVGYEDQSHFTALFHKHVALTPKAYRDRSKR